MTWRQLCPVHSPISMCALGDGIGAALGLVGDCTAIVEERLRERYNAVDVLLTDTGTSALIIALKTLLPRGATVALPGYACFDLTSAAVGADVRVRLYDLNPRTLSPDLDSVSSAIKRGVDAIVVAHLYGYPADVAAVQDLAAAEGVLVIEDAAQAAGGKYLSAPLGSLGEASILSFGRGKGTTAGSGGALILGTSALASRADGAREELSAASRGGTVVAKLFAQKALTHPSLYRLPSSIPGLRLGEMVYHQPHRPARMTAAGCAVLRHALELDAQELEHRRKNARELLRRMRGQRGLTPVHSIAGGEPGYLRLALLDATGTRSPNKALGALRGYPLTLEEHEELRPHLLFGEKAGKGCEVLRDRLFVTPTHSRLDHQMIDALGNWFAAVPATLQPMAAVS